jgi:hypothetical protein
MAEIGAEHCRQAGARGARMNCDAAALELL